MLNQNIWNADMGDGTYRNPILYADYSDPDAIRVGEDYFMISSSFTNTPGLPLLHSKDLVNWKVVNYLIKNVPTDRYAEPVHGCGVWAPAIRYHEGTYYVFFPMPDEGIYVIQTKDPFGEWSEPFNIRPAAGWIDPCPFWDEDGRAYMVAGVAKSRIGYKSVLHMVEMRPDCSGLIGPEVKVFDGNENDQVTIEGPKLYRRNGWYYIFAPAGGVKTGWQTVLRSRDIFGPYEYKVVMRQEDSAVNGPHQGAWVDTVTGEDWFLHFQDVYAAGRITHLQPMCWKEDWPIIGEPVEGKDYGRPVEVYRKPDVGPVDWPVCEPAASDDFTGEKLGLQWQWNANVTGDWYTLTGEELQLNAVPTKEDCPYGDLPNLLLQKWPAPEFICETEMDLSHLKSGDEAGVISMGMEYGVLVFRKEEDGYAVSFMTGRQKYGAILCESTKESGKKLGMLSGGSLLHGSEPGDCHADIAADTCHTDTAAAASRNAQGDVVRVLYQVKRTGLQDLNENEKNFPLEEVSLSYSTDGHTYIQAGTVKAAPGRWVGVKNGPFCVRRQDGEGGYLLVKSVEYSR
ncbi:MAG: glycoside hydrolase 43 family protein [Lachnospiraceae bacterium]|nr:glycoside hydrolase 43 family protein [Lachnospiraceae bacterium]